MRWGGGGSRSLSWSAREASCDPFVALHGRTLGLNSNVSSPVLVQVVSWQAGGFAQWRERTLQAQAQADSEDRGVLLQRVKDELPLAKAVELLQRYDPGGKHEMIVVDPAHQRQAQLLEQRLAHATRLLDRVIGVAVRGKTPEEAAALFAPLSSELQPLAGQLPNYRALAGMTADEWIMRNLMGSTPARAPRAAQSVPQSAAPSARSAPHSTTPSIHPHSVPASAGPSVARSARTEPATLVPTSEFGHPPTWSEVVEREEELTVHRPGQSPESCAADGAPVHISNEAQDDVVDEDPKGAPSEGIRRRTAAATE